MRVARSVAGVSDRPVTLMWNASTVCTSTYQARLRHVNGVVWFFVGTALAHSPLPDGW